MSPELDVLVALDMVETGRKMAGVLNSRLVAFKGCRKMIACSMMGTRQMRRTLVNLESVGLGSVFAESG